MESAKSAGLRYVTDEMPGIRRVRAGGGFRYVDPQGKRIRDAEELARIRSLVIPPAWRDVWICPHDRGHLQATGRDARGRKQHRYHPLWREVREATKFGRMIAFSRALPRIRRRIVRDLRRRGLPRERVLATVVRLLETSLIRVGNEEYAKENESFGLTTLRDKHVDVNGSRLRFEFRGKSGVMHSIALTDRRLAKIVKACQELPGQELFQYEDEQGERRTITSADVNEYLRSIAGEDFTSKDFRTWAGTVLAARALQNFLEFQSQAQAKRNIKTAVELVSQRLGNTIAVCRKCYVHPAIFEAYLEQSLGTIPPTGENGTARALRNLTADELAVQALLQSRMKASRSKKRALAPENKTSLVHQLDKAVKMARRNQLARAG